MPVDGPSLPARQDDTAGKSRWLNVSLRMALHGPTGPFGLDVEFAVSAGSFVALVGPSGAGKTTLLRLLAGLSQPESGSVRTGDAIWCDTTAHLNLPTRRRPIGFVFQDYALFPNMTVRRNVEYAIGRKARTDDVTALLNLVGLGGLAHAYPARLSGGQKQRLALIRALARRPALLMLDEPLSALDPVMRQQLQDEIKRLHRDFGTTTFLVSHDVSEILQLADRVIRLENGRIVFDGSPSDAFGLSSSADHTGVAAQHVNGPDDAGYSTVSVDRRILRIRYRNAPRDLTSGDQIVLHLNEVDAEQRRRK